MPAIQPPIVLIGGFFVLGRVETGVQGYRRFWGFINYSTNLSAIIKIYRRKPLVYRPFDKNRHQYLRLLSNLQLLSTGLQVINHRLSEIARSLSNIDHNLSFNDQTLSRISPNRLTTNQTPARSLHIKSNKKPATTSGGLLY